MAGQIHTALVGDVKGTAGAAQSWVYNTGNLTWGNDTGHRIYIKRCWVLMGVQGGVGPHDFSVDVWTPDPVFPGQITQIINENTTIQDDCTLKWESSGDYYEVPPGGFVYWQSGATLYGPGQAKLLECCVRIGFTIDNP